MAGLSLLLLLLQGPDTAQAVSLSLSSCIVADHLDSHRHIACLPAGAAIPWRLWAHELLPTAKTNIDE